MPRRLAVLLPILFATAGCATSSARPDAWDYDGPDAALKGPPAIGAERRREMIDDLGGHSSRMPSEATRQKIRDDFEQWRQRALRAMDDARQACVRETGDSGRPSVWSGHSEVFKACMKARGYVHPRGTDPL